MGLQLKGKKVKVSENALVQELGNDIVILNLDTERYYGLDQVGMRFWQLLPEQEDLQQIFEVLQNEYDVSPELLAADLIKLVDQLEKAQLIAIH